ncbi:MAG TPA: BBP7 family outer membrane beta-barrel protein [Gemmataceae bacterium]|nr:BBP7 family outer membrane beta-barrel protein [Gemmataceae bacterium]
MSKRWIGLALMMIGLGWTPAGHAQYLPSTPPAGMPEPMPCAPSMVPGPISPYQAPPGPGPDLGIPANIPGAFDECWYSPVKHVYVHVGTQALARRRPGHFPIAVLNPNNLDVIEPPLLVPPVTEDASGINPVYAWGPRGTIGILWDQCAVELSGFILDETEASILRAVPGRLNTFFFNPPLGFEGNNNLWLNADRIRTTLETNLASAELNSRWFAKAHSGPEWIVGVRYFDMQEQMAIFTDDEGLVFRDIFGKPDPTRQATYTARVHNRILAGQLGVEWQISPCCWLALGWAAKGAWGVNWANVDFSLVRGDGLVGFDTGRRHTMFSHMYDVLGFLELHLLERLRVRAGYTALWLLHVPVAQQQIDFDLSAPLQHRKDNGSVFYHGPQIEMQFLF